MTFWEKINAFFMSDTYFSICLFLLGVAALIWCVEMVCSIFVKGKSVSEYISDCEHKLNALLGLHNVCYWRDVYEPSRSSTRDVLDEINQKLDVLLSGPMDKETLEELKAEREDKPGEV